LYFYAKIFTNVFLPDPEGPVSIIIFLLIMLF